jgi:YD repeat-containing protein
MQPGELVPTQRSLRFHDSRSPTLRRAASKARRAGPPGTGRPSSRSGVYDDINRLTSFTTHPSVAIPNLTTSYNLDGNGNVEERTAGDGVITTYTYDALSRLSTVAAPGLATITYTYDELSHRKSMTDVTGLSTYTYDGSAG